MPALCRRLQDGAVARRPLQRCPTTAERERIAHLGIANRVRFLGPHDLDGVRADYRRAFALVYFRDFSYCDSGMIPWPLIAELVSRKGALGDLVAARRAAFPSSGEINFTLDDVPAAIARVRRAYKPRAHSIYETDGISLDMGTWCFNLRASNTEPVLRLNVETRGEDPHARVGEVRSTLVG